MISTKFRRLWTMCALGVIGALLVACSAPVAAPTVAPTEPPKPKVPLKLAANPWDGSKVNVLVAKLILEKELGYKVEIVDIDENGQFPALAKGDLSATLEIWPSGHAKDHTDYIETQKTVEDIGPLGVVGKISWYMPKYMVDEFPELATSEGLKDAANAGKFKTAETGEMGQFLGGDPSFVQYDEHIIKNLGLNLKVVYAGSEQAILAALDAAYSRKEPILFYFWTPHAIHAKYELVAVKLPDYSDACYAKAPDGVDCDYPADILYKASWAGLKDAAPDAYAMLKKMSYTTDDQIAMLADIANNGKSPEAAAQAWVDGHKATWEQWLK